MQNDEGACAAGFLPAELVTDILSRVRADFVLDCKLVCKSWRDLIKHPSFFELHYRRLVSSQVNNNLHPSFISICIFNLADNNVDDYDEDDDEEESRNVVDDYSVNVKVDYDDDDEEEESSRFKMTKHVSCCQLLNAGESDTVIVIGSCMSLVCVVLLDEGLVYIYNPFTEECLQLPRMVGGADSDPGAFGFGYAPSTDEYKLVCISYDDQSENGHVMVYTLGTGNWRDMGEVDFKFQELRPVYLNGGLHWFIQGIGVNEIASFDLALEEFRILKLPLLVNSEDGVSDGQTCWFTLRVLEGCFCAICENVDGIRTEICVWVLNNDSWIKRFTTSSESGYVRIKDLILLRSGKFLLTLRGRDTILCYDPRTGDTVYWKGAGLYDLAGVVPYVKSFVSLKALGKVEERSRA